MTQLLGSWFLERVMVERLQPWKDTDWMAGFVALMIRWSVAEVSVDLNVVCGVVVGRLMMPVANSPATRLEATTATRRVTMIARLKA